MVKNWQTGSLMTVKAHLILSFLWCLCITQLNKTITFFFVFYRNFVFEQAVWRQTGWLNDWPSLHWLWTWIDWSQLGELTGKPTGSWCNFRPHYSSVHQWPLSSNTNTRLQSSQTFDLKSLLITFECSLCCASEHLWKFWYLWKWIDESKQPLGVIYIHLLGCNWTGVLF